jgi:hypothetical protein
MKDIASLRKRLAALTIHVPEPEPWPPIEEGELATVLYNQLKAEGVELPEERPDTNDVFLYLLELDAPRVWAEYSSE